MAGSPADSKASTIAKVARGMRFPKLFVLMAVIFGVDLLIPDTIPFVDEIMLGLITAGLGAWRTRKPPALPPADTDEDESDDDLERP